MEYYLAHHGVKGQKWGVRRGPPYPLGSGQKSGLESSLDKNSGGAIKWLIRTIDEKRKRELDSLKEKYGNIGDSGISQSEITKNGREIARKENLPLKRPPDTTISDDVKNTNPEWYEHYGDNTWMNNCQHSVIAFACRRRGLDVVAKPMNKEDSNGISVRDTFRYYKEPFDDNENLSKNRDIRQTRLADSPSGLKRPTPLTGRECEERASQKLGKLYADAPDGAYGVVRMDSKYIGHVFNWYKEDGVIKFADSQAGINAQNNFNMIAAAPKTYQSIISYRTDNREFNPDTIGECIQAAPKNYLKHYGIQGQKWGVRRGLPYPIGSGKNSGKSLDRVSGSAYNRRHVAPSPTSSKLRKAVVIGTVAAVAGLATYQAYKSGYFDDIVNSNLGREFIRSGKSEADRILRDTHDLPFMDVNPAGSSISAQTAPEQPKPNSQPYPESKQKREPVIRDPRTGIRMVHESVEDSLKNTNPLGSNPEGRNNCTNCAVAGILRTMGFDVTAQGTGQKKRNLGDVVESIFENSRNVVKEGSAIEFAKSPEAAAAMLKRRYGDNAKGVVGVTWKEQDGYGHAFSWVIENGKVQFLDFQNGFDDAKVRTMYWNSIMSTGNLQFARLDNLKVRSGKDLSKYIGVR